MFPDLMHFCGVTQKRERVTDFETEVVPSTKKVKTQDLVPQSEIDETATEWEVNESGERYFNLKDNGTRRVTVRKFRGYTGVDIREYYVDKLSGEMKPGKKGIYLSKEQFETLKDMMESIDAELHALDA